MSTEQTEGQAPDRQPPPADELFASDGIERPPLNPERAADELEKGLALIDEDDHDLKQAGRTKLSRVLHAPDSNLALPAHTRLLQDALADGVTDRPLIFESSRAILHNPAIDREERLNALAVLMRTASWRESDGEARPNTSVSHVGRPEREFLAVAEQARDAEVAKCALDAACDHLVYRVQRGDLAVQNEVKYLPFGHPLPEASLAVAKLYEYLVDMTAAYTPRITSHLLEKTSGYLAEGMQHADPDVRMRFKELWQKYRTEESPEKVDVFRPGIKKVELPSG